MDILDDMGVSKLSAKVFSKVNYFNSYLLEHKNSNWKLRYDAGNTLSHTVVISENTMHWKDSMVPINLSWIIYPKLPYV